MADGERVRASLTFLGDEEALRRAYYPAVERLVRDITGAARVLIFDHTRRSSAVPRRAADGTDIAVSIDNGSGVRFGAHTAFVDPRSRVGARARESIELRTIALFG